MRLLCALLIAFSTQVHADYQDDYSTVPQDFRQVEASRQRDIEIQQIKLRMDDMEAQRVLDVEYQMRTAPMIYPGQRGYP